VEFAADSAGAELCSGHSGDDSDRAGIEIDMPFGVYGELVLCKSISLKEREPIRRSARPCCTPVLHASLAAIRSSRWSYAMRGTCRGRPPCPVS